MDNGEGVRELKLGEFTLELREDRFGRHTVSSPDLEVSIGDVRVRPRVGGSWNRGARQLEMTIDLSFDLDWRWD